MAETGQSADKTINLTRDFLGASSDENLMPANATTPPDNDDFKLSNSDQHLLYAAAVAQNGDSASFILPSTQQAGQANPNSETKKRKREEQQQTQLTIAEQAQRLAKQLAAQIAALESRFEARFGDSWREEIANRVMDPDDIPQRHDGEAMTDYRRRLEEALVTAMISADGQIRPEYANSDDPDVQRYAEWAQAQYQKRAADSYLERRSDPSLSDAQREQLDAEIAQSSIGNEMRQIQASLAESGVHSDAYQDRDNADYDRVASIADAEADAFSI